jgi:hypothetical protein
VKGAKPGAANGRPIPLQKASKPPSPAPGRGTAVIGRIPFEEQTKLTARQINSGVAATKSAVSVSQQGQKNNPKLSTSSEAVKNSPLLGTRTVDHVARNVDHVVKKDGRLAAEQTNNRPVRGQKPPLAAAKPVTTSSKHKYGDFANKEKETDTDRTSSPVKTISPEGALKSPLLVGIAKIGQRPLASAPKGPTCVTGDGSAGQVAKPALKLPDKDGTRASYTSSILDIQVRNLFTLPFFLFCVTLLYLFFSFINHINKCV